MSDDPHAERSPQPERVPTLTEVIDAYGFGEARWSTADTDWRSADPLLMDDLPAVDAVQVIDDDVTVESDSSASDVTVDEQEVLVQALQVALARVDAIDAIDDARLRAALQPLIARFTDGLVAAVRMELASSLRERTASQTALPPALPHDVHGAEVPSASSR